MFIPTALTAASRSTGPPNAIPTIPPLAAAYGSSAVYVGAK